MLKHRNGPAIYLLSLFPTKCTDWKTGSILIGSRRRGRREKSPSDAEGWIRADNGIERVPFVEGDHPQPCRHWVGPTSYPSSVVRRLKRAEEAGRDGGSYRFLNLGWFLNNPISLTSSSCFVIGSNCETVRLNNLSFDLLSICSIDGCSAIHGYFASLYICSLYCHPVPDDLPGSLTYRQRCDLRVSLLSPILGSGIIGMAVVSCPCCNGSSQLSDWNLCQCTKWSLTIKDQQEGKMRAWIKHIMRLS